MPPDPVHVKRVKTFFLYYALVTLLIPFLVRLAIPPLWPLGLACLLPLLPETVVMGYYVQQGRDDAPECRLLGLVMLLRLCIIPVTIVI